MATSILLFASFPVTDPAAAQSAFDLAERVSFQPALATFIFLG